MGTRKEGAFFSPAPRGGRPRKKGEPKLETSGPAHTQTRHGFFFFCINTRTRERSQQHRQKTSLKRTRRRKGRSFEMHRRSVAPLLPPHPGGASGVLLVCNFCTETINMLIIATGTTCTRNCTALSLFLSRCSHSLSSSVYDHRTIYIYVSWARRRLVLWSTINLLLGGFSSPLKHSILIDFLHCFNGEKCF